MTPPQAMREVEDMALPAKLEHAAKGSEARVRKLRRPVALVLGPHREAISGVSTHLNLLYASRLAEEFDLVHFQVGSEGRKEARLQRWRRLWASPFRLMSAILVRRAAIVHLNTSLNTRAYWRDLAYLFIAKMCGARVVYQVHGGALPALFFRGSRALTSFLRLTLMVPDVIVVLAQAELEAYRRFVPAQRVLAIPNGVDHRPYANVPRVLSPPGSPLRLVYFGRIALEKGLYELLQGLALAKAGGASARLAMAGNGSEERFLRERAVHLGLLPEVSFVGPVFGEDKLALLAAADVLVLPSHAEGLPYALLESMAAGVPVIATCVGAIPDVVVDGVHGILVPSHNPEAIARAIARLAGDRMLLARLSAACRARIAHAYTLDRLSIAFGRLYEDLSGGRGARAGLPP